MNDEKYHELDKQVTVNTNALEQVVKNQEHLFKLNQTSVEVQNSIKLTLERIESDNKYFKGEIVGIKKDVECHDKESKPRIEKFGSLCRQVTIQWAFISGISLSLIGCAVFIIRTGLIKG